MRRLATFLACAALAASPSWGDEAPQPAAVAAVASHPYWIGALCLPTDPAIRERMKLDDRGLTVVQVLPDSPAAKGGLKEQDIITQANGKPIKDIAQLMTAVGATGDKELKLEVFRGEESKLLTVRPEKRPERDVLRPSADRPMNIEQAREQAERIRELAEQMRQRLPEGEARQMQEWVEKFRRGEQLPLRMHTFGPGVIVHSNAAVPLPEGVTVTLKKSGAGPTSITVERGDETWTLNEKELHRLPKELQGPVGAMVGGGGPTVFGLRTAGGEAAGVATSDSGSVQVQIQTDDGNGARAFTLPLPNAAAAAATSSNEKSPSPATAEIEGLKQQVELLKRRIDELQKNTPSESKRKSGTKE